PQIDSNFPLQQQLKQIVDEKKDVFIPTGFPVKGAQAVINTGNASPIAVKMRRFSPTELLILREGVEKLENAGIIEKTVSPWNSNPVIVTKKNGEKRICINYKPLNKVTVADKYPLPKIADVFLNIAGKVYHSTLDCLHGFHLVEVAPSDRPKTAFTIPNSQYQYRRMP